MSTNDISAERDVWKQRAEEAEAKVKTLREGINEFLTSVRGGDNGLAVYQRLEALVDTADTTTEKE